MTEAAKNGLIPSGVFLQTLAAGDNDGVNDDPDSIAVPSNDDVNDGENEEDFRHPPIIKNQPLPRPPQRVDMERTPPSSTRASPSRRRPQASATTTMTGETSSILTTDNTNAMTVGLMAQGLHWVRRQRDRRQRLYLQNQAEQQLLKIRQAQQAERQQHPKNSLEENVTFQSLTAAVPGDYHHSSSNPHAEHQEHEKRSQSILEGGDGIDHEGGSGSQEGDEDDFDVAAAAAVSRSGDGYSVELAVEDAEEEDDDASYIPPVRCVPEPKTGEDDDAMEPIPFILNKEQMQQVAIHVLPSGIAYCRWKRLYSLARDGDAFDHCLTRLAGHHRTLMVIRTSRNAIFGGFADQAWEPHMQGGTSYFGGPTACLFTVHPTAVSVSPDTPTSSKKKKKAPKLLVTYKWTGANRYVQLVDVSRKMLAFGGGGRDGAFGLCVQQDFQVGSTGPCATFGNAPLCEQENFSIVDMEVFGFMVGQF